MCLILFAYRVHDDRPLVIAANRDEFYAREALAAHWWDDAAGHEAHDIFGGRDLEAHGTWLAVSGDGRLAAITNWTEDRSASMPRSRGDLPKDFLRGRLCAQDFAATIDGARYAGFNFLAFDGETLLYTSNRTGEVRDLAPGVYGLTNTRLGARLGDAHPTVHLRSFEVWPKAVFGAAALKDIAATASADALIDLLAKPHVPLETPADRELAPERSYSPCFIHGAEYGTRASTAVILAADSLEFTEQQYGPFGQPGDRASTTIKLA